MICPCCHTLKEKKDFYWRGEYLVYQECKVCKSEKHRKKQEEKSKVSEKLFNIDQFAKYYQS